MTITVLFSVTNHMAVVGINNNYLLSIPIPYSLCPPQVAQLVLILYLMW